jgi:hypothetical protein
MRGPKEKWRLTARAVLELSRAVDAIAAGTSIARKVRTARIVARKLRRHVEDAEECERD